MQNLINKYIIGILLVSFLYSCATTKAPKGWLPNPADKQTDIFGGWLVMEYSTNPNVEEHLVGELIAINQDSIFIADDKFYALALSDIKSAQLEIYNSNSTGMGGLVFLGILSTASNGLFSVFTAPLWLIGGIASTTIRSYEPMIKSPKQEMDSTSENPLFQQDSPLEINTQEFKWDRISQFARFPQGLPPKINRQNIKMKSDNE